MCLCVCLFKFVYFCACVFLMSEMVTMVLVLRGNVFANHRLSTNHLSILINGKIMEEKTVKHME